MRVTRTLKIEEANDIVRDEFSSGIINVDNQALVAYRRRKNQSKQIETLTDDINTIKYEMQELRKIIVTMVHGK